MSLPIRHSVTLDPELCVGCTTCIKKCPTQAIRVRDGKARIMEERCIDCGECIRTCPKGAKKAVSDPVALMDGFDLRVALPAPSLYAQFGSGVERGTVLGALRALGFEETFDVAWGAVTATGAARELLARPGPRPLVSSACPAVVRLVQIRFPSLLPHLAPVLPPVELAAREAKRRLGNSAEFAGAFFISPCAAKVTALKSPQGYADSAVDAVIAIKDIHTALKAALGASPSVFGEGAGPSARGILEPEEGLGDGIGWARSDGELEALRIPGAVSVDGIANVIALFEEIERGKLGDIPYVEALACPGGCVGGPMAVANPHVARSLVRAVAESEGSGRVAATARGIATAPSDASPGASAGVSPTAGPAPGGADRRLWTEPLAPLPAYVLDRDLQKALAMVERLESIAAGLPGLDCGACGAPDCRALAEDIVKGLADEGDCTVRMRESARELLGDAKHR